MDTSKIFLNKFVQIKMRLKDRRIESQKETCQICLQVTSYRLFACFCRLVAGSMHTGIYILSQRRVDASKKSKLKLKAKRNNDKVL